LRHYYSKEQISLGNKATLRRRLLTGYGWEARMASTTKPLSAVDSAWLHMEDPTNLMMVTGIALLDGASDHERYRQTIAARLLTLDRFRMRVVESGSRLGGARWEEDPHFDLAAHLHRVALPVPGDMGTLQKFLSDLASTPLDFSKPLWQVHLVENVLGGSAMVLRFHHCIGDGTAMNGVMYRLMNTRPDAPVEPGESLNRQKRESHGTLGSLLKTAEMALGATFKVADMAWGEGTATLGHPAHLLDLAGAAVTTAEAIGRALLLSADANTLLKGRLGTAKRVAWSRHLPLADVKRVCKATGAKVNDVMMAAVAGALRGYLIDRGTNVDCLEIRAIVPVDLRPPARALDLGNEFGLVFLALPLGLADPQERLAEVKRRMDALKRSPEPQVFYGLLNVFGMTPAQVEEPVVQLFGSKATAVVTNVAGPREALYIAGSRIDDMMFWVPQSGRLGLGISILSYNERVTLGVIADAGLVPDPGAITAGFEGEFEQMVGLLR
jgi:diacylglycerol O-acyltransferase / wax synthase